MSRIILGFQLQKYITSSTSSIISRSWLMWMKKSVKYWYGRLCINPVFLTLTLSSLHREIYRDSLSCLRNYYPFLYIYSKVFNFHPVMLFLTHELILSIYLFILYVYLFSVLPVFFSFSFLLIFDGCFLCRKCCSSSTSTH